MDSADGASCWRWGRMAAVAAVGGLAIACAGCGPTTSTKGPDPGVAAAKSEAKSEPTAHEEHPAFYSVASYNEAQDPDANLAVTLARAKAEHKRVILQVGGEWCGWCKLISNYMATNETIRNLVDKSFVVMKVTYPGDHADEFLAKYPKCDAYPHFFILDADGKLLHSQGTGELESGQGYNDEVFAKFLATWSENVTP
ncbi:MAG: thioredoxin family protein [Pirellulales bacterium]